MSVGVKNKIGQAPFHTESVFLGGKIRGRTHRGQQVAYRTLLQSYSSEGGFQFLVGVKEIVH